MLESSSVERGVDAVAVQMTVGGVGGNLVEPSPHSSLLAQRVDLLPGLQQRLLQQVPRILVAYHQAAKVPIKRLLIPFDQLRKIQHLFSERLH